MGAQLGLATLMSFEIHEVCTKAISMHHMIQVVIMGFAFEKADTVMHVCCLRVNSSTMQ